MTPLEIKTLVRHRDGMKCTQCGMTNDEHFLQYGCRLEVHRLSPGSPYTVDGCVTLCKPCHGPQPRSARYRPGVVAPSRRNDLAVKVNTQVVRACRIVAAFRCQTLSEYLSEILAPIISQDLEQHKRGEWPPANESAAPDKTKD